MLKHVVHQFSPVQIVQRVRDLRDHLHSSFRRQFLYRCVSLFPERLRVAFERQSRHLPLLPTNQTSVSVITWPKRFVTVNSRRYLEEAREDVGRLTADDEQTGVEFTKTGVQILQTLQQKPETHTPVSPT